MFSRTYAWQLALGIALCIIVGNTFAAHNREGQLHDAQARAAQALKSGERQKALTDALLDQAGALERRADSALAVADSIRRERPRVLVRYVAARDSAPAECAPALAAADSVIRGDSIEADRLRSSLADRAKALAGTRAALDSVRGAYERLEAATRVLTTVSRPSLAERLLPRFGVGVAAGVDPITRRPATVAGVTLGWQF